MVAVVAAVHFAAEKHRKQMRKDGERPYINHPVTVMHILASEAGVHDPVVLQAAVLHDTGSTFVVSPACFSATVLILDGSKRAHGVHVLAVEDTDATVDELRAQFGDRVAYARLRPIEPKALPSSRAAAPMSPVFVCHAGPL